MDPNASGVFRAFLNTVIAWDHQMFVTINGVSNHPFMDKYFPLVTDLHKSPLGLALVALLCGVWMIRDRHRGWKFVTLIAIVVACSDLGAYRVVKPIVQRPRPEFTTGLPVTLRVPSTHSYSFPSNHACNMFAVATIVWFALPGYGWWGFWFAALIAYSRVYVGVHFPLDVLGGAFIGFIIGRVVWNLLGHWAEREPPEKESGRLKTYRRSARNPTGE